MSVKPMHDRILVEPSEVQKTTAGGIVLPGTVDEKTVTGTVLDIGEGRFAEDGTRIPVSVKTGDKVLFNKGAGHKVTLDSKEFLILKEDEVLAVYYE
jgi:chaperonin GroES